MLNIIQRNTELDDNIWNLNFEFYQKTKLVMHKDYQNVEEFKQSTIKSLNENRNDNSFIILENDSVLGTFNFQINDKEEKVTLHLNIIESYYNSQLFQKIFETIGSKVDKRYKILIKTRNKIENDLLAKFRIDLNLEIEMFLLRKEDLNTKLLKEWEDKISTENQDFSLQFYDEIPDDKVEEYTSFFNELLNQMPEGKKETQKYNLTVDEIKKRYEDNKVNNGAIYSFIIFNNTGEMIAKSNVHIDKNDPSYPYQFMTGVKDSYRGKQLGRWLKSKMYTKLFEDFPEIKAIITEMYSHNKYIQNINSLIGYKNESVTREYIVDMNRP
ncbi:MAG: hypothetical protein JXR48_05385 [Candidatus Delongbacteria bacterium]|nr:hypothetical protein [Candidatus Delongbacteria bacterium]MBN2834382.1 hypothetical protein [Candidatus Delongbacteria bacterium]